MLSIRRVACLCTLLALCGCQSTGIASLGFVTAAVGGAFIPLEHAHWDLTANFGAAVVIAPGIAVTNAHNRGSVREADIIGESRDNDLLFFRTKRTAVADFGTPVVGERVVAYGLGEFRELREARGTVTVLNAPVKPRCTGCAVQSSFVYQADGGEGFSGGPVVDASSGAILGITFGFQDEDGPCRMYAYSIAQVRRELLRIQGG